MRIVIAAVAAPTHVSGVTRHAANMARCIIKVPAISSVDLLVAPWQFESFRDTLPNNSTTLHIHQVALEKGTVKRNLWYYSDLPGLSAELHADIVHLAYPAPVKRAGFTCPVVVTLHDLYPYDIPENFGIRKLLFNRIILQQCLRAVDSIACVSENTRQRLKDVTPSAVANKALTIYNCVDPGPPMATNGPLPDWAGEPFFLCVAQHRRNKNILLAMQVFRQLLINHDIDQATKLLIVGIEGPETEKIKRFIGEAGFARQIILLHGVGDAELQWCYGHCELLLAPSIIEGFGLPVVEGMLHNCRIVCSDIPAFREIGDSSCHFARLNGGAVEAFVGACRSALKTVKSSSTVTDRFSGARVAESYLNLYTSLCNEQPRKNGTRQEDLISTVMEE